jgi:hypothetical protein
MAIYRSKYLEPETIAVVKDNNKKCTAKAPLRGLILSKMFRMP